MPDSPLKLKPIKDLLDEVLGDVEPIVTYSLGDTTLEFWNQNHISEKHHLRFVAVQVEQMVVGRQYTAILNQLNELSDRVDIDANVQKQVSTLTRQMAEKLEELLPLNCQFIEALAELEPGQLLQILETELSKRQTRKKVPMALFVNTLASKIREAMTPTEEETEAPTTYDEYEEETDSPLVVEAMPELIESSPSTNNVKQLASTSSM